MRDVGWFDIILVALLPFALWVWGGVIRDQWRDMVKRWPPQDKGKHPATKQDVEVCLRAFRDFRSEIDRATGEPEDQARRLD